MVSGYNAPYTLDGGPVKLSLAGSAWWRRREIRTGTREKAVVPPVSFPSSRTETWGKLPGSPARLCARFLALVSWCPGCVGGPGLWLSVLVLCVGLVPSCAPGLVGLSGFVLRVCFKKRRRPRAPTPKTGFSDHGGRNEGRRPEDRSFHRYPFLHMGSTRLYAMTVVLDVAAGYLLWSLSWPLLSSSSPLSLVCSNPPVGAGGRTPTCADSPWRSCVFLFSFVVSLPFAFVLCSLSPAVSLPVSSPC